MNDIEKGECNSEIDNSSIPRKKKVLFFSVCVSVIALL